MSNVYYCYNCERKFGLFWWKHICQNCKDVFCSECCKHIPKYTWITFDPFAKYRNTIIARELCKNCWDEIVLSFDEKYNNTVDYIDLLDIEVYPKTYLGIIPIDDTGGSETIKTNYFKDRNDAIKMLKVSAHMLGFEVVYNMTWHKSTRSKPTGRDNKGTYYYSVWCANGIAAKLL